MNSLPEMRQQDRFSLKYRKSSKFNCDKNRIKYVMSCLFYVVIRSLCVIGLLFLWIFFGLWGDLCMLLMQSRFILDHCLCKNKTR